MVLQSLVWQGWSFTWPSLDIVQRESGITEAIGFIAQQLLLA